MIEADYNEIEEGVETSEELDFADSDNLPWLESDEDDDGAGGVDKAQMLVFVALLAVIGLSVLGAVYLVSNYNRGPVAVADGSLIEAPEGPYKERPENAGGKQFAGTDDVAPGTGQGRPSDGRMAEDTGAGSGDQNLAVAMPPIGGEAPSLASGDTAKKADQDASNPPAPAGAASSDTSGVGVQVGAYSSRARAEEGWQTLRRQSSALAGAKRRILEGRVEGSVVFRLQAVAPTLGEARTLCSTLRRQGIDCQVKS